MTRQNRTGPRSHVWQSRPSGHVAGIQVSQSLRERNDHGLRCRIAPKTLPFKDIAIKGGYIQLGELDSLAV